MKSKIAAAIISAYESKPPEYVLGPDEIAEIVLRVIREEIPAEKKGILYHGGRQDPYSPTDHEKLGFNTYRSELLKLLED